MTQPAKNVDLSNNGLLMARFYRKDESKKRNTPPKKRQLYQIVYNINDVPVLEATKTCRTKPQESSRKARKEPKECADVAHTAHKISWLP